MPILVNWTDVQYFVSTVGVLGAVVYLSIKWTDRIRETRARNRRAR